MRPRASAPNLTSLPAMMKVLISLVNLSVDGESGGLLHRLGRAFDDAHDVALLHDQQLFAVDLDLGAGPLPEQDAVADLDVQRHELAGVVAGTRPDGDDLALLR